MNACFDKIVIRTKKEKHIVNFESEDCVYMINEDNKIKDPKIENMKRFKKRLAANKLTYIDVGGEGNCLFHCLAAIFYGNKKKQMEVRKVPLLKGIN